MQIHIPTKLTRFFTVRILSILCVFLVLVSFLAVTTSTTEQNVDDQPNIQFARVTGADLARLHAENRQFLCVDTYLYVVIDNHVYGLVDSFDNQLTCKVI